MFGYQSLHRLLPIHFTIFSLVLVSIKKIYQTLNAVFDRIAEHLDLVHQNDSAKRHIFNFLLGGQTWSFMFDI